MLDNLENCMHANWWECVAHMFSFAPADADDLRVHRLGFIDSIGQTFHTVIAAHDLWLCRSW